MSGTQLTLNKPWYDTEIVNCSFCGIMIAQEYWADDDFPDDLFCQQACADVKRRLEAEALELATISTKELSDV
jgi:hypothetical protein|tara:strand:+ start:368 stop:586 length:219 start_codon:yes stop_codon:yes gene_type:complete